MSNAGPVPESTPSGGLSLALRAEWTAAFGRLAELLPAGGQAPVHSALESPAGVDLRGAVALAAALALSRRDDGTGDWLAHAPGTEGALLAMGVSRDEFLDRVPRREPGAGEGRPRGIPWSCSRRGFMGSDASPGTLVEAMAGVTLAFRVQGAPRVGMVVVEEGTLGTGGWHEGVNLAAVQRAPMVVVLLRTPSPVPRPFPPSAEAIAAGYGLGWLSIPAEPLEGVTLGALHAVESARRGDGVQLLDVDLSRRAPWPPESGAGTLPGAHGHDASPRGTPP